MVRTFAFAFGLATVVLLAAGPSCGGAADLASPGDGGGGENADGSGGDNHDRSLPPVAVPTEDAQSAAGSRTDGACDPTEVISADSYDHSCSIDSDCTPVGQGSVCQPCVFSCPSTAINVKALPQFKRDLVGTPAGAAGAGGACRCPLQAGACCRGGTCHAGSTCSGGLPDASTTADAHGVDADVAPLDGPIPPVPDGGHCAGALVVHLGETIMGTTCSGAPLGGGGTPCRAPANLGLFVFVDAPDGVAIHLDGSPGLQILGLAACDSDSELLCGDPLDPTDVRMRVFAIQRIDTMCGDFSLSVSAR